MKHFFWIVANMYARIFGRKRFASFHHALVIFFLHALGYDNGWKAQYTGESWFLENVLKKLKPKVCIDVGASIGNFSRELLRVTNAEIYAFEPTNSAYVILKEIEVSSANFHAVEAAVGDHDGTASFFQEGARSERNSLSSEGLFDPQAHNVKIFTLDTFTLNLQRVDFIKVDTEGFEKEVFAGMQKTISRFRPIAVQFEFNILHLWRGHTLLMLSELLNGYSLYRLLPQGMIAVYPKQFIDNIFMFSNFVAVRNDLNSEVSKYI